jgi:hypothetical protein
VLTRKELRSARRVIQGWCCFVKKDHEAVLSYCLRQAKSIFRTPLSCAVEEGSVAVVQLLLAQGVKTDYNYNSVSRWIDG